ncbi:MAG: oligosaccharide flippase family protein, partial [Lachnospiraceae bacterium]|nr:oligosaccharide flippase family protein [Lachnospiraceae bacterium]
MGGKVVNMTEGKILPQMVRFGLPVLLGMLFQRIYNFVDVYIVGKYLGDQALASVSIAGTAMYLLASVMMGLSTGVSVVISRYYGAKEMENVVDSYVTSIYVSIVSVILITALGMTCTRPLLGLLQTSEEL